MLGLDTHFTSKAPSGLRYSVMCMVLKAWVEEVGAKNLKKMTKEHGYSNECSPQNP